MDITKLADWAGKASGATLLCIVLMTGYMGVWKWGTEVTAMKAERDEWKGLALKATTLAEKGALRVIGMTPPTTNSLQEVKSRLEVIKH